MRRVSRARSDVRKKHLLTAGDVCALRDGCNGTQGGTTARMSDEAVGGTFHPAFGSSDSRREDPPRSSAKLNGINISALDTAQKKCNGDAMIRPHFQQLARYASRYYCSVLIVACALASGAALQAASDPGRVTLNFNPDWRFIKEDPAGAEAPAFNDAAWTIVSAPHTYNDVDTFDNWSTPGHRGEQIQWSGRTWYRKTFALPDSARGKKVFIEFESVRQIAEVYLNGKLLGVSKAGFSPFGFDLTPHLKFDGPNVLAVMADNRFMKDPLDAEAAAAVAAATETSGGRSSANPNLRQMNALINATIPEDIAQLQAEQIPWNNPHWHPAHGGLYLVARAWLASPIAPATWEYDRSRSGRCSRSARGRAAAHAQSWLR